MSSLRNAVKRITHKERSQPQARAHLGFLEKKKDYKKRAENYHRKEDTLKAMKQKASMRNPDEFYFGMHKAQVKDGKHQKTEEARQKELEGQIGADAVRIMKDQDLRYVRMQRQRDTRKAQRLEESLHCIGSSYESSQHKKKRAKHTIFVTTKEEAENFDAAKHFDTAPELVERSFNRPRQSTLRAQALYRVGYDVNGEELDPEEKLSAEDLKWESKMARKAARTAAKARANAYGELEARVHRAAAMAKAEAHLVTEKLVSRKGRKEKIKPAQNGMPAQYRWQRKRKR